MCQCGYVRYDFFQHSEGGIIKYSLLLGDVDLRQLRITGLDLHLYQQTCKNVNTVRRHFSGKMNKK